MKYLIIGNGAVARNISSYFTSVNMDLVYWHKSSKINLAKLVHDIDIVFLAISTSSLQNIFEQYPCLNKLQCIHFSGSYYSKNILGMHPLMSFPKDRLLELKTLQSMSFGIDFPLTQFNSVFPMLKNPIVEINPKDKIYYHFLCVMSGNFSKYLWEFVKNEFNTKFGDSHHLDEYLKRTMEEILDENRNFTGPLERRESDLIDEYDHYLTEKINLKNMLKVFKDFRREEFHEIR